MAGLICDFNGTTVLTERCPRCRLATLLSLIAHDLDDPAEAATIHQLQGFIASQVSDIDVASIMRERS